MAGKLKKVEDAVQDVQPVPVEQEAPERQFVIGEKALNTLVDNIANLSFKIADPMIKFIQANFKEVTVRTEEPSDK